jgi:predicted phage-related endonuclease
MRVYLATVAPAGSHDRDVANAIEYENVITAIQSQDTEKITAAQTEYIESIHNLQKSISESTRSALSQYLTQVQTAWQEAQEESKASCLAFVDDIKIAFTGVSAADVDAASLAAIGQTLITAAVYVSGSLQSLPATPVAPQLSEGAL